MNSNTLHATYGGLLRGIGKLHKLPHSKALKSLINIAEAIATGNIDNKELQEDDFIIKSKIDKPIPALSSIFNIINGRELSYHYKLQPLKEELNYPEMKPDYKISPNEYQGYVEKLWEEIDDINLEQESVNSLLNLLETHLSFFPSNSRDKLRADISLYDHCKMTAALAACISEYMHYHNRLDNDRELIDTGIDFHNEKAFLMFSGDFSGIQSFIYNIITEGALKSLRSRSFFLELLMEHIVDEVLEAGGVTRANLIYSGGGHCYLLLPNTEDVIARINKTKQNLNKWLIKNFGTKLYFACAVTSCSANDLMNIPAEDAPYEQIFRRLSRKLSQEKMHRYSAEDLIELNTPKDMEGNRECKICGTEDQLLIDNDICTWCNQFEKYSNQLLHKELVILISKDKLIDIPYVTFPTLPGQIYCYFTNAKEASNLRQQVNIKRIYSKNRIYPELPNSIKLYMGDYVYNSLLNNLVDKEGIRRISVLRADVDNLGQAFISGFTRDSHDPTIRNQYNNLARTAAFSRQMSLFFKYHLNFILQGQASDYKLPISSKATNEKRVVTVYAGGDDIFLIGNIGDILESTVLIHETFTKYTSGGLTISFGIGIYPLRYPIYLSASETEALESLAKENDGKNSVSLYTIYEDHTYKLDNFKEKVLEEKLPLIAKFFSHKDSDHERGTSFLYRLMELLKSSDDRINIARYAYTLSRLEPRDKKSSYYNLYSDFSEKMYGWILSPKDRKELLTAIYIYIYLTRKGAKDDE
ncbi:MAG: type III-A CRISPR-associated protein Cas10/Csm1 [Clostridiales bacterium]|nr:type III-A CRISPR-associated protein Cas10/Csm1 [Clostridiales bacterium]